MSDDKQQRDPITGEALGSDPVPMGSTVSREDSSDLDDSGQNSGGRDEPGDQDPEDRDDGSALPDDGLS